MTMERFEEVMTILLCTDGPAGPNGACGQERPWHVARLRSGSSIPLRWTCADSTNARRRCRGRMNHQQSRALDRGDAEPGTTDRQSAADFMVNLPRALLGILLSPLLLACWLERRFSPSDRWLMASGELLSMVPGAV